MADVPKREVENVEFVFEVMGSPGVGIDCVDLGDALRALNLNPTLALIEKMGGTKKRNEKKMTMEEFLPVYSQVKKEKEQGCYEDFIECLKLYDKQENGTMLLAELQHALLSLGEALDDEQVEQLFADCLDPEDDEGMIPYSHVEFVFEVMGSPGVGIDCVDLGDALRALNLNPTLALIEKMGGTKKRNEKKMTMEEFLPVYSQVKKEKEQGCYEDFIECLKLYDKQENGTMLLAELQHALLSLGEALDDEQVEQLFADCLDPEDDEGMIPYSHVEFVFEVMGSPGVGIDCVDLGDALRALNLNPTLALIEKMGGTKKRNEKKMTMEEFLPVYSQVKKEKEQGCYEDFIECLKLYDKQENGTMLLAELQHALLSLGEALDDEQVEQLFADCLDPEDDEGMIPYSPFLARMCERPDQL